MSFFRHADFSGFEILKNFFLKIQILGTIEKCMGWFLVYLFLGSFFIKSAKRMCMGDYAIFAIGTY